MKADANSKPADANAYRQGKADNDSRATEASHDFHEVVSGWMSSSPFQAGGVENLNAMSKASGEAMRGAMDILQETGRFVTDRLQKDIGMWRSLGGCRTPEDYFRLHAEFLEAAIRDYADETSKVARMAAETTQCACRPLQERTSELAGAVGPQVEI